MVPNESHERHRELPPELSADVFGAIRELTPAVEDAVDADGTTVGINEGEAAGQEVPHLHVHIVPRFEGDGGGPIHAVAGSRPDLSEAELDEIAAEIRECRGFGSSGIGCDAVGVRAFAAAPGRKYQELASPDP